MTMYTAAATLVVVWNAQRVICPISVRPQRVLTKGECWTDVFVELTERVADACVHLVTLVQHVYSVNVLLAQFARMVQMEMAHACVWRVQT